MFELQDQVGRDIRRLCSRHVGRKPLSADGLAGVVKRGRSRVVTGYRSPRRLQLHGQAEMNVGVIGSLQNLTLRVAHRSGQMRAGYVAHSRPLVSMGRVLVLKDSASMAEAAGPETSTPPTEDSVPLT